MLINPTEFLSFIQQVLFDAPYNRQVSLPRMQSWKDWKDVIYTVLCPNPPTEAMERITRIPSLSPISVMMQENRIEFASNNRLSFLEEMSPIITDNWTSLTCDPEIDEEGQFQEDQDHEISFTEFYGLFSELKKHQTSFKEPSKKKKVKRACTSLNDLN